MKSKYVEYRDFYITSFVDYDKELFVMVNIDGDTLVENFTSNFFSKEDLVINYYKLISKCATGADEDDIIPYTRKYMAHIVRVSQEELNMDYINFTLKGVQL